MAMSKKDYEAIARIMRRPHLDQEEIECALADYMTADNPRTARFLGHDRKESQIA